MNAAQIAQAIACVKTRASLPEAGVTLDPLDQPLKGNLGNGLYSVYLVDEGSLLTYVTRRDLEAAAIDPQDLHRNALANLATLANQKLRLASRGGVHMLTLDGHFEASLLLLDNLWDKSLADYLPTAAVAAVPARDVLAFCDAGSIADVRVLAKMARETRAVADHALTDQLYVRQNGEWKVLDQVD